MMITLLTAKQNRPFTGTIKIKQQNNGGPYVLPQAFGTYELRLYRHNNTTPFATGTIANGKMAISVTAEATVVTFGFPVADMANLAGYGSMELISTVVGSTAVTIVPIMFTKESDPYVPAAGEELVIFQEQVVCVVESRLIEQVPGPFTVAVNMLAAGQPASGNHAGSLLTLNIPRAQDGAMSAAEIGKGVQAASLLNRLGLSLRKGIIIDGIGGGYAEFDEAGNSKLCSLEAVPGVTITNSAGPKILTRKRTLLNGAANTPRYNHAADGTPQGLLIEPSFTYLNGRTQPTVAQLGSSSQVTDGVAPTGWSGNWISFGDNSVLRWRYSNPITTVIGQDYWVEAEIFMEDGNAPVVGTSTTTGDFGLVFENSATILKKPSDGSAGADVIGPLAGGVYLVRAYFTATSTNGNYAGAVIKYVTQTNRQFRVGRVNCGAGRYPLSGLDNTSATPNSRLADNHDVPLSGFSFGGGIGLLGEFVFPRDLSSSRMVGAIDDALGSTYIGVYCTSTGLTLYSKSPSTGFVTSNLTGFTPGTTYRFAAVLDPFAGFQRIGATGKATVSTAYTPSAFTASPAKLHFGKQGSTLHLGSSISELAAIDRLPNAADMLLYTG